MAQIYFDANATTPIDPRVLEAMMPYLGQIFGNPSSVHSTGRAAREAIDAARTKVCAALGAADPESVIFTASGSEANSLAICGLVQAARARGASTHLVVSAIEHSSVLAAAHASGADVTVVAPGADGIVRPEAIAAAIRPEETLLASVMVASNEVGTLQPVKEICTLCHERGVLFHTDAVQALGKLSGWGADEVDSDLVSISAHKVYGPKGAGALYCRPGLELAPQVHGGHQENSRRGGTENVAALVGFGTAVALAELERVERVQAMARARDRIEARVLALIPDAEVVAAGSARIANTTSITFPRPFTAELLVLGLDLEGVAVSAGSACAAGTLEPSHVLVALRFPEEKALRTVRFSVCKDVTDRELSIFEDALERTCERIVRARSSFRNSC